MNGNGHINSIGIDLSALRHNLRLIHGRLRPGTDVLMVVKAEAYGHGMVPVARAIEKDKSAVYLGVSTTSEAFRLREEGIRMPVLIMGVIPPAAAAEVIRRGITSTVSSQEEARVLDAAARRLGKKARVHVELDTGMGRLGVWCEEAVRTLTQIHALGNIELEGVFTHFPAADDAKYSKTQIAAFEKTVRICRELFGGIRYVHMANSQGLVSFKDAHFTLVRPGIMAYGIQPAPGRRQLDLRPVLSLKSRVALIKEVGKGRSISYARTHVTRGPTRIATIPIGYSSGYPWQLSNRFQVLIGGRPFPIVGRVTMDHIMVDIGGSRVKQWDEVVLIGRSGRSEIRAEELAEKTGTIPYEIVCRMNLNLPRIYKD